MSGSWELNWSKFGWFFLGWILHEANTSSSDSCWSISLIIYINTLVVHMIVMKNPKTDVYRCIPYYIYMPSLISQFDMVSWVIKHWVLIIASWSWTGNWDYQHSKDRRAGGGSEMGKGDEHREDTVYQEVVPYGTHTFSTVPSADNWKNMETVRGFLVITLISEKTFNFRPSSLDSNCSEYQEVPRIERHTHTQAHHKTKTLQCQHCMNIFID